METGKTFEGYRMATLTGDISIISQLNVPLAEQDRLGDGRSGSRRNRKGDRRMGRVLPILFNTDMVRAILDGRKTVTRRVVKHNVEDVLNSLYHKEHPEVSDKIIIEKLCMPQYQPGDILYVRETWFYEHHMEDITAGEPDLPSGRYSHRYIYKADNPDYPVNIGVGATGWRPSIHMPKEAARIWLRCMDVRVERLQEMWASDVSKEGIQFSKPHTADEMLMEFAKLWNSTLKKTELGRYGWDANPWVWVIEFERCEKPESE